MRRVRLLLLELGFCAFLSCGDPRSLSPQGCSGHQFSDQEVRDLVEIEMRRIGLEVAETRPVEVRIQREGCGYLYLESDLPRKPGGFLSVRLGPAGEIKSWQAGV